MKPCIHISEINKSCEINPTPSLTNELKITNISSEFISDLKLIIRDTNGILHQCVTRERGTLTFEPHTTYLELGNLGPDESAYFEYKFATPTHLPSLTSSFSLLYTETTPDGVCIKKVVECLSTSTTTAMLGLSNP